MDYTTEDISSFLRQANRDVVNKDYKAMDLKVDYCKCICVAIQLQAELEQLKSESGFGTKLAEDRAVIKAQAAEIEDLKFDRDNYKNRSELSDKASEEHYDKVQSQAAEIKRLEGIINEIKNTYPIKCTGLENGSLCACQIIQDIVKEIDND